MNAVADRSSSGRHGQEAHSCAGTRGPGAKDRVHIDALDGLRALSILIVLFGHAARTRGAPVWLWALRDLGVLGVYLFFSISGFVITLLMLREHERYGRVALGRFWQRRALRILPPFAIACVGIALATIAGIMPWRWQSFVGAVTFTRNTTLFGGDWFFGHFWSLSAEEQFYLAWPLLFGLLMRRRVMVGGLLAVVLMGPAFALIVAACHPLLDGSLPCVPYLALGCLLAGCWRSVTRGWDQWRRRRRLRLACLIVLPLAAVACHCLGREDDLGAVIGPFGAAVNLGAIFVVLFESLACDGYLREPLTSAPLRVIGVASYSLYLWQQLFLGPAQAYSRDWYWSGWPQNLIAAGVVGLAAYCLVERPLLLLRRRVGIRS